MIVKNPTAGTVYCDIYQPTSGTDQNYIPAGATVDLIADGNATQQEVYESLLYINMMVEVEKLQVVSVGVALNKADSLANIATIFKSFLSPTFTLQWTENGRLSDKNYMHNGVLSGGTNNGFILPYDCEPVEVSWSLDHDNKQAGSFVFHNNSDNSVTLGTVNIADDHGHDIEKTGVDFTAFKCPKDKRIAVQWQGPQIDDVTLNVTFREV